LPFFLGRSVFDAAQNVGFATKAMVRIMGETYDARREMPGWSTPDFDDDGWKPVDVTEKINARIESYPSVLVRKFQEIKPVSMTPTQDGAWIYDMGTNFAGFVRLNVRNAEPGQKIILRFVERLNPDGTFVLDPDRLSPWLRGLATGREEDLGCPRKALEIERLAVPISKSAA